MLVKSKFEHKNDLKVTNIRLCLRTCKPKDVLIQWFFVNGISSTSLSYSKHSKVLMYEHALSYYFASWLSSRTDFCRTLITLTGFLRKRQKGFGKEAILSLNVTKLKLLVARAWWRECLLFFLLEFPGRGQVKARPCLRWRKYLHLLPQYNITDISRRWGGRRGI